LNDVVYCIRKSSRHKNKIVHLDSNFSRKKIDLNIVSLVGGS